MEAINHDLHALAKHLFGCIHKPFIHICTYGVDRLTYALRDTTEKCFDAVAQKSPCACNLQHRPPLTQLIKLSLSLFKGSALHAESLAMLSKALPFLR